MQRLDSVRRSPVASSVVAPNETLRLAIFEDFFSDGIKVQAPARPDGNVAQMAERCGKVPFLDISVGPGTAANAIQKVAVMR